MSNASFPDDGGARRRLDLELVARALAPSRARAQDLIRRGLVSVAGAVAAKPGLLVDAATPVVLAAEAPDWVSRAAEKLVAGLDHFDFDPKGLNALDLGASTGGFTEVLLARGAAAVLAVDVGHGQIHPKIGSDPRVIVREGLNARDLSATDLPWPVGIVVSDMSFISLKLALPPALALAAPGAFGVFLVKPQFEVGRAFVGKGGLVRDVAKAEATANEIAAWLGTVPGWRPLGLAPSPIAGGDGNREFLLGAVKDPS